MKKLLTLVVCCSLSAPSFGVDWIRDRIYTSSSYGNLGVNYDLGYHYTDSVKISVGSVVKPTLNSQYNLAGLELGLMAKLHYHHQFESTDITPYITFGTGGIIAMSQKQEGFFSYQIGAGINLPLSERTNVFAGYKLHKFSDFSHGFELGMSFNL
ncbi:outer membrane beta-barrel protein [Wolbachia endosymbiont (group B) of Horisme vitalbata]|uniref:outer membrane beta-barrel protein n=1 Tax=Wolbachia endosymbiont (group B) of Horisme vitalbata TaxID=3066178 RepID=UPI00334212D7